MKEDNITEILPPYKHLNIYGYRNYFQSLIKLYEVGNLPNTMLFSGPRGIGKSTFAYHFANYLLSQNEDNKYSIEENKINKNNKSYNLVCNNSHPNLFILENDINTTNIKIDSVRNLINFLNKTTYSSNLKIVILDNVEFLNENSSNALLKALEEPGKSTFFFIIHDSTRKLLETIVSRSLVFKLFFSSNEKKEIFEKIIKSYNFDFDINKLNNFFYYDSPGNLVKYLSIFDKNISKNLDNKLLCISFLIEKYKKLNNPEILTYISTFIEFFYYELSLKNLSNINYYFRRKYNVLRQIDNLKKFNIDKENFFISLNGILGNES
tara:strand:+ start:1635 stop:2603 length:969 start_codon:yes stop_codon:yes gene_type:complete